MGCICPTERKGAHEEKQSLGVLIANDRAATTSSSQRSSQRKSTRESTKEKKEVNLSLRADEVITHLIGAFRLYYRTIAHLHKSKGCEIFTAEYLSTKQRCVVRKLTKNLPVKDRKSAKERLAVEADRVMKMDHPHVLRTLELLQDADTIYIVSEGYQAKDLQDYIDGGGVMTERQAAILLYQLLSALSYSHQQNVSYKYLTPRSVVFQEEIKGSSLYSKLVPYGSLEAVVSGKENRFESSSDYRAPEVDLGNGTEKSDVWTCGVILSYILTGESPLDKIQPEALESPADRYAISLDTPMWRQRDRELMELVRAMVAKNPEMRPPVADCINSPWLQRLSGDISVTSKPVRTSLTNLRSSTVCTTLKEAVMRFIVSRVVKEQEINELSESFLALDLNKDGVISYDELLDGYRRIMPDAKAKEEADKVMRAADKDGNGEIDYSEFLLSSFSKDRLLSQDNLRTAFKSLDEDGSGQISLAELKHVFAIKGSEEGEAQWQKLILEADTSGDGEIDFYEFVNLMTLQLNRG